MTDTPTMPTKKIATPLLVSRWWALVLALSLMFNLLIVGAMIGMAWHGPRFGQAADFATHRLLPRKFVSELLPARRRELMNIIRDNREQFDEMRNAADTASLKLADALDQGTYDPTKMKAAIDEFNNNALIGKGSAMIAEVINRLTPEERIKLASDIRDRKAPK